MMALRGCFLGFVFGVLACLGLSSAASAQYARGEHIAVLIGNELYPDLNHNVDVTPNNLKAFEAYLSDVERVRGKSVLTLRDQPFVKLRRSFDPRAGEIARFINANPKTRRLTVYYSGHGTQDPSISDTDKGILLGTDAEVGLETLYGVSTAEIIDNLGTLAEQNGIEITLILEACFNGQTGSGDPINSEISGSLSDELGRKPAAGVTVVSASSKTQPAYWQTADESEEPLSRFTDAFLDALYGYGGGLDDGALTMAEALKLTNASMDQARNEQVATVSGFIAEDLILRKGSFVDRLATQMVCEFELVALQSLSRSCSVADIEAQLNRQQCRYPSRTQGYQGYFDAAVARIYQLERASSEDEKLNTRWSMSSDKLSLASSFINTCQSLEDTGCSWACSVTNLQLLAEKQTDLDEWSLVSGGSQSIGAINSYLGNCENRIFCQFETEAKKIVLDLEKEEQNASRLVSDALSIIDSADRLIALRSAVKRYPQTNAAKGVELAILDLERSITADETSWQRVNKKDLRSIQGYLEGCKSRTVCRFASVATSLEEPLLAIEQNAALELAQTLAIEDYVIRRKALDKFASDHPFTYAAVQALEAAATIDQQISADSSAWKNTDEGSLISLQLYLEGCNTREVCINKTEAESFSNAAKQQEDIARANYENALDLKFTAEKIAVLKGIIRTFPGTSIADDAKTMITRLKRDATFCVLLVPTSGRRQIRPDDIAQSRFSMVHLGEAQPEKRANYLIFNIGEVSKTINVRWFDFERSNAMIDTDHRFGPAGNGNAFSQWSKRFQIDDKLYADVNDCVSYMVNNVGLKSPHWPDNFAVTSSMSLNLNDPNAETVLTAADSKNNVKVEFSEARITESEVLSTSGNFKFASAIVTLKKINEGGRQTLPQPLSVYFTVVDGDLSFSFDKTEYGVAEQHQNLLEIQSRESSQALFSALGRSSASEKIYAVCNALRHRKIGETLLNYMGLRVNAGTRPWDIAQKCVWESGY